MASATARLLALARKAMPDFGPLFGRHAKDLKKETEGGGA
jgi:hypothetical protein